MPIDIVVPTEQEGTKAVVKNWLKQVGDTVRVDDPVVELETDKVAVEIAATASGVLSEILVESGAEVEPGALLGRIADGVAKHASAAPAKTEDRKEAKPASVTTDDSRLPPGIRRLLSEHGLEARDVTVGGAKL